MKKTILALAAGLCLSAATPVAMATNKTCNTAVEATETARGVCCTPRGCVHCLNTRA